MHKLAAALASILLLLGGAGCGGGSEDNSSAESSDSFDADAPEAEDPNAEEAPDESGEAVAVELPGLPIGGNTEVLSDTLQCVDVGWTEPPDLPDWIGITVTGVTFTPEEGFTASSEQCPGGAPACLGGGFQLTGDERCYVAVAFTGEPTLDADRTMSFSSGVINCPPDRVEQCEAFREEVESEGPQVIGLDPAPSEFETGEGEGEGETDPESTEESSPDETDDGGG
jgi:hypothetical protein